MDYNFLRLMPTSHSSKRRKAPDEAIAAVETRGRTQAVKLPRQFHLDGKRVRIRREGERLVLEPLARKRPVDLETWWAELDRLRELNGPFLPEGRPAQPPMPPAPRFEP